MKYFKQFSILAVLPLLVAVVALSSGCTKAKVRAQTPQTANASEIIFSHGKHIEEDVDCEDCHDSLGASKDLTKRHSPKKEACGECHEDELEDKAECKMCHRNVAQARKLPRLPSTPRLVFSHKNHLARKVLQKGKKVKVDCLVCHTGAAVAKTLAGVTRPKMRGDCFECHNHQKDYDALRCEKCHESLAEYPIKFVSAFNHGADFIRDHSRWAKGQADVCASCHRQQFCADCHSQRAQVRPSVKFAENTARRFIHRGDWLSRHPVQARADAMSCKRCHSSKTCDACHTSRGVSASALAGGAGRSPHPAGWLSPGSPNSHGIEARRRISLCASCHDQGPKSNCIRCHKATAQGGLGINPHPPGYRRGGKTRNKMCLFCH
jgi:c(7)-type cytochrome triheme protein